MASILAQGLNIENCPLKELTFDKCKLKFGSMKIVMQSLHKNRSIKILEFIDQFIHEKEASVISEMFKMNKGISKLALFNCGLDDASLIQLS